MTDEATPGETPTEPASETPAAVPQPQPETPEALKAELDSLRKALKEANSESAKRRKLLEQYETEKKAKEEQELSEMDKLKKRLAETEAELTRQQMDNQKRAIAEKVGLPAVLATRIQGKDEIEMEADAKTILDALPKAPKAAAPGTGATNPGGGRPAETDAERRRRLGIG